MNTTSSASYTTVEQRQAMHAVSQIIERNLLNNPISAKSGLWINPERDGAWLKAKASCGSFRLFSQDYGSWSYLQPSGADTEFAAFPRLIDEKYDWIILNLPRQKALLRMLLDCASGLLSDDGRLWLAGENKAGIKSADKLLKSRFGRVRKLDNARHCTLFEASAVLDRKDFDPLDYREQWTLDCSDGGVEIASYPGVFAHGRIDAGSALLLEALNSTHIDGDVLDFACGAGVIGACIASSGRCTSLTLLDSSALAVRSSRETLELNALDGVVLASDGLSGLDGNYDVVVTNPPIHAGVKTDNQLSIRLMESMHEHIRPGGKLILVANVHLPYERWLSGNFGRVETLAGNRHYKVLIARK